MSQRHKKTKTTKINIKGKTMHPNSTKYPKMVKQQHRDIQRNKNNTFYNQNKILEVVPASQKSNKIQMDSNCKTKDLNFTGHILFHCHSGSKRKGMAMHTWTINMIIF